MIEHSKDIYYWLCLYLVPGLGNIACKNLIRRFGKPETVFSARLPDLIRIAGIREKVARNIVEKRFAIDPDDELKRVESYHAKIIPFADHRYPGLLREIHDPPFILYVRGQMLPWPHTFLGIVGSRNATEYGRKAAHQIGSGLAKNGVGIVSGLALGIDSASHWGCIRGGGFTVGVLGTGVDVLYPPSNESLLERILETGAVISEFPMGTPPEPRNFPIRNRIISGMSRGIVVVEATKRSGSLITASLALEQGRDVFAVPGSIDSFKSRGTHFLIKQGAKLVENADDILNEMGFDWCCKASGNKLKTAKPSIHLDAEEKRVFDYLGPYPTHIDEIIQAVKREPGEVLSVLMRLELMGIVTQLPGMTFVKAEKG